MARYRAPEEDVSGLVVVRKMDPTRSPGFSFAGGFGSFCQVVLFSTPSRKPFIENFQTWLVSSWDARLFCLSTSAVDLYVTITSGE